MKKIGLNISFLFLLALIQNVSFANLKYDPNDLDKFNSTNQCIGCDLSNSTLSGNHSKAILQSSNLTSSVIFNTFSQSDFTYVNGSHGSWSSTNFSYANFSNAILNATKFTWADLEFSNFSNAVVMGADFSQADLYGAKITSDQLATAASVCNAIFPDGTKGKCP